MLRAPEMKSVVFLNPEKVSYKGINCVLETHKHGQLLRLNGQKILTFLAWIST